MMFSQGRQRSDTKQRQKRGRDIKVIRRSRGSERAGTSRNALAVLMVGWSPGEGRVTTGGMT